MDNPWLMVPAICLTAFIFTMIVWHMAFGRSMRRMLMTALAILLGRDNRVDPDAPIEIPKEEHLSDMMIDQAKSVNFETAVRDKIRQTGQLPRAKISEAEMNARETTTTRSGWPVRLPESLRNIRHGFRFIHFRTENDEMRTGQVQSANRDPLAPDDSPKA